MRNAIKYYYNIDVDNIRYNNNSYYFDNYILKEIYSLPNIELYNSILNLNIPIYKIINNINNEYITIIDNKKYILLYKDNIYDSNITYNKIINDIVFSSNYPWDKLWEKKIDYFENNIVNIKNKELLSTYPYYIGLSELSLRLYKENNYKCEITLSHKRIETYDDLYDPFNIIVDYKIRDLSEYIKYCFFNDSLNKYELINFLNSSNLNEGDYYLLFVRLLFPTYFYDSIEKNIDMNKYISRINNYEVFLNYIYNYLSNKTIIPRIDWLIKK